MLRDLFRPKKTLVTIACLTLGMGAYAQVSITNEAELKAIANDLAGSYVLANDITISGEWTPLAAEATPFTGTLDGAGHSIKGLTITTKKDNQGLFSFISGATVKNVRFINVNIAGNKQAGAVAGQAIASNIDQVFASGVITGYDHVGGIVGDVRGDANANQFTSVTNCMSTVGAYSSTHQAGVLVGWVNAGIITNNFVLGSASAPGNGAGGITPIIDNGSAEIVGNIIAPAFVSGYGSGDNHRTHAIVGFVNGDASICSTTDNYYSTASKFYESGVLVEDPSTLDYNLQGDPIEPSELELKSTYTSIGFDETKWSFQTGKYPVPAGMTYPVDADAVYVNAAPEVCVKDLTFDPGAISTIGKTVTISSDNTDVVAVDGTTLKFVGIGTATVTYSTATDEYSNGVTVKQTFTVTSQNYNIATAEDLLNMKNNLEGDYKLVADIDMTGVTFSPLGEFSGSLDGQGHIIKNLTYNNEDQGSVALFSTMRGATIKNVGIEGANIVGNDNVAAFVGKCYGGEISQCYVTNSYIEGRDHVAAFTGDMNRNGEVGVVISDCISDAKIKSRQYQASGIAGVANGGTMQRCLFSGTVDNSGGVAGLISLIDNNDWETYPTNVENCLSAPAHLFGSVSLDERMIHLSGRGANVSNNYALASTIYDVNGGKLSDAGDKDGISGESVDDATAKTKDFYETTLGWDFTNTWKFFEGAEGKMYPVLKWMNAPLPTSIYDMPKDLSLLYTDGSEKIDVTTMHGSWGQTLTFTLVENADKATVVPEDNAIYAGDENGYYAGSGEVKVEVGCDAALASILTTVGDNTFTFYVGQSGDVTKISTPEEFLSIAKNLQGSYELSNDIDMKSVEFEGFAVSGTPFSGSLNGNGHKVKNLGVKFSSGEDKGIFGQTSGAKFTNVAFENFVVDASSCNHVGFVGSASSTTFEQVALTGQVIGRDHVALLAGDGNSVTVNNTYVWGDVTAYSQSGGFFGCTLKDGVTVTKSYFNGSALANYRGWVGGFVGLIDKAESTVTITNCVSIGDCSSTGDGSPHTTAPFIAGNNAGDTPNAVVIFSDNIYNVNATMDGTGEAWPTKNETADGGNVVAAESVNASVLAQEATYTNIDWDFSEVWAFDASNGYTYPVLKTIGYVNYDKEATGINDTTADTASAYAVYAHDNVVTVAGAGSSAKVTVFNTAGQVVNSAVGTSTVTVPGAGLYIVSITENGVTTAYKVINK